MTSEDQTNTDDWPTTVRIFRTIFAGRTVTRRPAGIPSDPNFLTSELLGYVKTPSGDPAEVATGWFLDSRVFGITFPRVNGMPDERDTSAHCWRDVLAALGFEVCEYGAPSLARCVRIAGHEGDHVPDRTPFAGMSEDVRR